MYATTRLYFIFCKPYEKKKFKYYKITKIEFNLNVRVLFRKHRVSLTININANTQVYKK